MLGLDPHRTSQNGLCEEDRPHKGRFGRLCEDRILTGPLLAAPVSFGSSRTSTKTTEF